MAIWGGFAQDTSEPGIEGSSGSSISGAPFVDRNKNGIKEKFESGPSISLFVPDPDSDESPLEQLKDILSSQNNLGNDLARSQGFALPQDPG